MPRRSGARGQKTDGPGGGRRRRTHQRPRRAEGRQLVLARQPITAATTTTPATASSQSPAFTRCTRVPRWLYYRAQKERRLQAMAAAVAAYEAELGVIDDDELIAQARADRETAIVVRRRRKGPRGRAWAGAWPRR